MYPTQATESLIDSVAWFTLYNKPIKCYYGKDLFSAL